jgi:hypothetical protein
MVEQEKSVAAISRAVGLSRQWVYELIRREGAVDRWQADTPWQNGK